MHYVEQQRAGKPDYWPGRCHSLTLAPQCPPITHTGTEELEACRVGTPNLDAVSSLTVLGLGVCRVAAPLCHRQLCTKTVEAPPTATPASGGGIFSRFWVWLNDDSGGELVSVCLCAYTCTSVCSCTCSV